ncbi:MAG: hydroxyacylglutathione hydrolase [Planctomycetota bacterium]|jgi:hydroxyacylglutathione hydrolase
MKAIVIPVTRFRQNCSLLICELTLKAAVVDPGGDLDRIIATAIEHDVEIEKILVTHAHVDHAGGVAELAERLNVPIEGPHRDDIFWIDRLVEEAAMFDFPASRAFQPERWLDQGDVVQFGDISLNVHHCPGHTPGHVIFHQVEAQLANVGDVLFRGTIGRSDIPRGDQATLIASIKQRLWPLGDEVEFIPGHGPTSTFGHERLTNPYVADRV